MWVVIMLIWIVGKMVFKIDMKFFVFMCSGVLWIKLFL